MVPKFEVICLNKKYEDDWLMNKFTNAIMLFTDIGICTQMT
jgi:hypothetical protein